MGTAAVLVVDDEPKIRELVRAYLERGGYAVLLAGSGQQALELGARARPDLVVLDLMLPDLPGEEVARSLRALSDVPIVMLTAKTSVMLTAKTSEQDRVAGLRLGADDYLVKPFSPRERRLGSRIGVAGDPSPSACYAVEVGQTGASPPLGGHGRPDRPAVAAPSVHASADGPPGRGAFGPPRVGWGAEPCGWAVRRRLLPRAVAAGWVADRRERGHGGLG